MRILIGDIMSRKIYDLYDRILKLIIWTYRTDFLKFFGIDLKIVDILNVEFITLNGRKIYLDFLCRLDDGTLCNIEFQFPRAFPKDLNRFFNYNIIVQATYGELTESIVINFTDGGRGVGVIRIGSSKSFHPRQLFLGDVDFEEYFKNINKKVESNTRLTVFEEMALMLRCLVVGFDGKAEALKEIVGFLKKEELFDEVRFAVIQVVIRHEIDNLLSFEDGQSIREELNMSPQAEYIINRVMKEVNDKILGETREEGKAEAKVDIARNLKGRLSVEEIAAVTGLSVHKIREL